MANYVSIEAQYTPLDVDNLKSDLNNKGFFSKFSKKPTILLIIGIVAFLGSLTYAVTGRAVQKETKAAIKKNPAQISSFPVALNPITNRIKEFPTTYREITIPESLYTEIKTIYAVDTPGRKNYVIDKIVRFYIYQEALEEADLSYIASEEKGEFNNLIKDVTTMEQVIKENVIRTDGEFSSLDKLIMDRLKYFK